MPKTDSTTTIAEIREWSRKVRTERNWHPNAKDLAISISLEVNELLEFFQWGNSDELEEKIKNNPEQKQELELEVGDVVNYLCEFADRMDIDVASSLKKTLEKVEKSIRWKSLKNTETKGTLLLRGNIDRSPRKNQIPSSLKGKDKIFRSRFGRLNLEEIA